jgi:hypothetical protein
MAAMAVCMVTSVASGQTPPTQATTPGGPTEPARLLGRRPTATEFADARLRPVVGVHHVQAHRASLAAGTPERPYLGYLWHHQTYLAHWQGKFWMNWVACARDEHDVPTVTLISSSPDGYAWSPPQKLFDAIEYAPGKFTVNHQRMSFYVAPNGRMIATAFQGIPTQGDLKMPNTGVGVGRLVREIKADGTLGPVHFIRYMPHAPRPDGEGGGYTEENTKQWFPYFLDSPDEGFRVACTALLDDPLYRQQWWEEDRNDTDHGRGRSGAEGFFGQHWPAAPAMTTDGKAFCWWTRADGRVAGIWKVAMTAVSDDAGTSWSKPVQAPTFPKNTSKFWVERTSDGKYALVCNPFDAGNTRYPLLVAVSSDGISFGPDMGVVHPEVPLRRYKTRYGSRGPNYVRGIEPATPLSPGNGTPPDGAMWLAYDDGTQDVWVARVPVPIRLDAADHADGSSFENDRVGSMPQGWNVYSPVWAPVSIRRDPSGLQYLSLVDREPADYATATRIVPASRKLTLEFQVRPATKTGQLDVEIVDRFGNRPVRLSLVDGGLVAMVGQRRQRVADLEQGQWATIRLIADSSALRYELNVNGEKVLNDAPASDISGPLERVAFRTGDFRQLGQPNQSSDLPDADLPDENGGEFHVTAVRTQGEK